MSAPGRDTRGGLRRRRSTGVVVFCVGVGLAAVVAPFGTPIVSAHATLERSVPSANSVLEAAPTRIELDFDDAVDADLAAIELFDAEGDPLPLGPATALTDDIVAAELATALAAGLYAVRWRVTSLDGHRIDGAFAFQVGTAAVGDGADDLLASLGTSGSSFADWVYGVERWVSMLGAILVVGAGWWMLTSPSAVGGRDVVRAGGVALAAGSLGGVFGFAAVLGESIGSTLGSTTGQWLVARAILGAVAAAAVLTHRRIGALVASVGVIVSFPLAGHSGALEPRWWWVAVDSVHLTGVALWLGGVVLFVTRPRGTLGALEAEVRRFSRTATVAVPVVIVTGVVQAFRLAGSTDDLTAGAWGRTLLVKVTIVTVVVVLGAAARWLLHHEGSASLRRTLVVETIVGVVIVALAAAMVGLPPRPAAATQPFEVTITSSGVIASVVVTPGQVGANEVHIVVTPPGGAIAPVDDVTARVSLPAAGVPAAPVTLEREGPNHYSGVVTFTEPGDWSFEVIVSPTAASSVLLRTTVAVS